LIKKSFFFDFTSREILRQLGHTRLPKLPARHRYAQALAGGPLGYRTSGAPC